MLIRKALMSYEMSKVFNKKAQSIYTIIVQPFQEMTLTYYSFKILRFSSQLLLLFMSVYKSKY